MSQNVSKGGQNPEGIATDRPEPPSGSNGRSSHDSLTDYISMLERENKAYKNFIASEKAWCEEILADDGHHERMQTAAWREMDEIEKLLEFLEEG